MYIVETKIRQSTHFTGC